MSKLGKPTQREISRGNYRDGTTNENFHVSASKHEGGGTVHQTKCGNKDSHTTNHADGSIHKHGGHTEKGGKSEWFKW